MTPITVIKRDAWGNDVLSYRGVLIERSAGFWCIEAAFGFADRDLGYVQLRRGDIFREWFYADRWFNIFQLRDVDSRQLKGWYCNITRPPVFERDQVAADDLCLDVFVYPDGRTLLLDETEFLQLCLPPEEQRAAHGAVNAIMDIVRMRWPPFDEIVDENG